MFCSSCGKSVNAGLSYCNHCGARVAGNTEVAPAQIPASSFNLLVLGLLGVPIVGLAIIVGLLVVMKKELGFGEEMIGAIVLMSFLLLLTTELGLFWLLRQQTKASKWIRQPEKPILLKTPDLVMKGLTENQMRSIHEPMQSITEHTTRTLDAVPRESGQ